MRTASTRDDVDALVVVYVPPVAATGTEHAQGLRAAAAGFAHSGPGHVSRGGRTDGAPCGARTGRGRRTRVRSVVPHSGASGRRARARGPVRRVARPANRRRARPDVRGSARRPGRGAPFHRRGAEPVRSRARAHRRGGRHAAALLRHRHGRLSRRGVGGGGGAGCRRGRLPGGAEILRRVAAAPPGPVRSAARDRSRRPARRGVRGPLVHRRAVAVRPGDGAARPSEVPTVFTITADPSFGALVSFGIGGVATELLAGPRVPRRPADRRRCRRADRGTAGGAAPAGVPRCPAGRSRPTRRPGAATIRARRRPTRASRPAAAASAGRAGRNRCGGRHGADRPTAGPRGHPPSTRRRERTAARYTDRNSKGPGPPRGRPGPSGTRRLLQRR